MPSSVIPVSVMNPEKKQSLGSDLALRVLSLQPLNHGHVAAPDKTFALAYAQPSTPTISNHAPRLGNLTRYFSIYSW